MLSDMGLPDLGKIFEQAGTGQSVGEGNAESSCKAEQSNWSPPFLLAAPCNANICSKYVEQRRCVCLNTTYFLGGSHTNMDFFALPLIGDELT